MNGAGGVVLIAENPVVRLVAGLVALYVGYRSLRWGVGGIRRAVSVWRNEPIPIGEAVDADGTVEIEGTAETLTETVSAPYSNTDCFAYRNKTKRKKRTRDSDGDWETNTRTVDSGSGSVPFELTDETGSIPVDPSAATIGMDTEYRRSRGNRRSATGEKIRTEKRIDPGDELHVVGQKRPASAADDELGETAFVGDGDEAPTFRITEGSELETVLRMFGRSLGAIALGVGLIGGGVYLVGLAAEAQFALSVAGYTLS